MRNFFALESPIKSTEIPSKKYPQSPEKNASLQGIANIFLAKSEQLITKAATAKKFRNDGVVRINNYLRNACDI